MFALHSWEQCTTNDVVAAKQSCDPAPNFGLNVWMRGENQLEVYDDIMCVVSLTLLDDVTIE
jgi:hypothetical protein